MRGRHRSFRGTSVDRASGRRRSRCRTAVLRDGSNSVAWRCWSRYPGNQRCRGLRPVRPAGAPVQPSSVGIQTEKVDLSAIDAALRVDHPVVRRRGPPDRSKCRIRTAVGHRLTELDFSIGDPWTVSLISCSPDPGRRQTSCRDQAAGRYPAAGSSDPKGQIHLLFDSYSSAMTALRSA
jgi:hypothetical protein